MQQERLPISDLASRLSEETSAEEPPPSYLTPPLHLPLMISKRLYTLGLGLLTLVALPSCNDAIDTQQQRRENNEKVFRTFKGREGYSPVSIPGIYGSNFVYMKYTTRGKGKEKPAATDNVRCEYTGYLTTEWVEDSTQARPFDSNTSQTLITPARVNTYITGFAIAYRTWSRGCCRGRHPLVPGLRRTGP